jgi:DNA-binding winged helix-turn-helix (wHTH) protein
MEQIKQSTTDFLPHVPISLVQRRVLSKLLEAEGNVVPHEQLQAVWPESGSRTALEMAVFNLRKKLKRNGYKIISHRGLGYSIAAVRGSSLAAKP